MNLNFKKFVKMILWILLIIFLAFIGYFFVGKVEPAEEIKWGINFSQKHSETLGLNWQENYLALLDDLGVKNLKIITHWDLIEQEKGEYNFEDLDWQIEEADKKGAKLLLVIGMKTGRWPECHIPDWAKNLKKEEQQERILQLIEKIVLRYRVRPTFSEKNLGGQAESSIWAWQVENEPFFPFGECPWKDKKFLKREIDLVKSLDFQKRPVIISDTGELSLWFRVAKIGDIVGTTMYKKVWSPELNSYFSLPYPSIFYWRKAQIIKSFFGKKVICVELQAEPWGPKLLYDSSLEEQEKTMNLGRFKKNIEFAEQTGLDEFYLWGSEWWYWMKTKQNRPEIWQEAKKLF